MRKLSPNAKPITILKAVAAKIQAEPEHYNQEFFCQEKSCGTAFCVAGWVTHLSGVRHSDSFSPDGYGIATRLLGLDYDVAWQLFYGNALNPKLKAGTTAYARAGVAHIEKFMRTHLGYTGPKLWVAKKVAGKKAVAAHAR